MLEGELTDSLLDFIEIYIRINENIKILFHFN